MQKVLGQFGLSIGTAISLTITPDLYWAKSTECIQYLDPNGSGSTLFYTNSTPEPLRIILSNEGDAVSIDRTRLKLKLKVSGQLGRVNSACLQYNAQFAMDLFA